LGLRARGKEAGRSLLEVHGPWHELAGQLKPELKFTNYVRSVN
jgi:hypothetical protein